MEWRTKIDAKPNKWHLGHNDKIMLIGSCFVENIGEKLKDSKFDVCINPSGILFNPVSICKTIDRLINLSPVDKEGLVALEFGYKHLDFHGKFFANSEDELLDILNVSVINAHHFLKQTDVLVITLGSSWCYKHVKLNRIVANCHKVSARFFEKFMLPLPLVVEAMEDMLRRLYAFNPKIKVLFTVSPVRHLKDGMIENSRSKAALLLACDAICDGRLATYFPAYEMVMDDLRDYRFYERDLLHPNELAVDYIWENFQQKTMSTVTIDKVAQITDLNRLLNHKVLHPDTASHRRHLENCLHKIEGCIADGVNFREEKEKIQALLSSWID